MAEELKPIDVSKYTVTESGNVIRTDNKETLKNALERITELESENAEAKEIINAFLDFEASAMERGCYIADDTRRRAEDFIKE